MSEIVKRTQRPTEGLGQRIGEKLPYINIAFELRDLVYSHMERDMLRVLNSWSVFDGESLYIVDGMSEAMHQEMQREFQHPENPAKQQAYFQADAINRYINYCAHLDQAKQLNPKDVPVFQAAVRLRNAAIANYQVSALVDETRDLEEQISPILELLTRIKDFRPSKGEMAIGIAISILLAQPGAGFVITKAVREMGSEVKKQVVFAEGQWLEAEARSDEINRAYKGLTAWKRQVVAPNGQNVLLAPEGISMKYLGAAFFSLQTKEAFRTNNKWIGYTRLFRQFVNGFRTQLQLPPGE